MISRTLLLLSLLPLLAQAESRTWTMKAGTGRARFRVEGPLDAITGSSPGLSGALAFDEGSWGGGTGQIRIDLSSFTTGLSLRDEDLRDQFFQVDRYPEAILTLVRLERTSGGALVPGREAEADAVGTLSLHGREQPVRIPIAVQLTEGSGGRDLLVRGRFDVALADYAIVRPSRLFLKLGPVAQVNFESVFHAVAPARPPPALPPQPSPTTASVRSFPKVELSFAVAHRPAKPKATRPSPSWEFAFTSPEGRGERLFRDPGVGGEANGLSCASCHGWIDERWGWLDPSGHVSSNSTLWNSARRPSFWRGFADSPEKGANLCARRFMLKPGGADPAQLADLGAYLKAISPDAAPALDFGPMILGRKTAIDRPTGGDPKRGATLTERFCGRCHTEGGMRPPLEVGLYEPDYLVARIRWISPHDAKQMPPMPMDRLRDSELRDIVTYLVGTDRDRIFHRKRAGGPRTERIAPPPSGLAAVSSPD
jgi:polyisoprenoid-binding protein YceI